jgi:serine/threonine protein phosphatase PrpC
MIRASSFTAAGGHAVNEDAFLVRELPPDAWLIVLADGQGGRAGGARAAQLACQTAVEHATRAASFDWREVLAAADAAVAADRDAGFTTLVGLSVSAGRVAGASCGDGAAVAVCGDTAPRVLTSGSSRTRRSAAARRRSFRSS